MSSTFLEGASVRQCVVCGDAGNVGGGDWMLVYHYTPPDRNHACGRLIHENCRYRDNAPRCPCGFGPADEGLTQEAVHGMNPSVRAADADDDHDRDEAVPTAAELAALAMQGSVDSDESDWTDGSGSEGD